MTIVGLILATVGGDTAPLRFPRTLGRAEPTRDAMARALGMSATTAEPEWRALVRSHTLVGPSDRPSTLKLGIGYS